MTNERENASDFFGVGSATEVGKNQLDLGRWNRLGGLLSVVLHLPSVDWVVMHKLRLKLTPLLAHPYPDSRLGRIHKALL